MLRHEKLFLLAILLEHLMVFAKYNFSLSILVKSPGAPKVSRIYVPQPGQTGWAMYVT